LKHNTPRKIDYLSIDTEGSEFDILKVFPFSEWMIQCLTVEHNNGSIKDKIFNLLSSYGYERVVPDDSDWDDWYIKKYK